MPSRGITVTTTREAVAPYNPRRSAIMFHNRGAAAIFISNAPGGATADDWEVPSGVVTSFLRSDEDEPEYAWYAQAASGSQDVRVWESYGRERIPGTE